MRSMWTGAPGKARPACGPRRSYKAELRVPWISVHANPEAPAADRRRPPGQCAREPAGRADASFSLRAFREDDRLPGEKPGSCSIVHDLTAGFGDRQYRVAQTLLPQISMPHQRIDHRPNLTLGQGAEPAERGELVVAVLADLFGAAAGNEIDEMVAAESTLEPCCAGEQDPHGLLCLRIDRRGLRSLAVVAPAAAVRQGFGVTEVVHDRLLTAAGSVSIAAHQVELFLPELLPLFPLLRRHRFRPTDG